MYRRINDYGIIGNLQTIALIADDGSIDWLCLPAIDSPAVFAALLDDRIGGRFRIQPEVPWDSVAAYLPRTNILTTRFRTRSGAQMELTDFMPLPADKHDPGTLYRRIKMRKGTMPLRLAFEPKFDYARAEPQLEVFDGGVVAGSKDGGMFAEEYDPEWREALGNYPQAFSHVGLINSVVELQRKSAESARRIPQKSIPKRFEHKMLVFRNYLLNDGQPPENANTEKIAADLKHRMNILRGAFFRVDEGRVAYEEMHESEAYRRYVACSYALKKFEPASLQTREEKLAFWINLYNVIVINGVIELGIRNSVKEVPRFFRRIRYRIGEHHYSADDIEHGILRDNHRLPHSLLRPFHSSDPRRRYALEEVDPRIHFALVCASVSCPPIEVYTSDNLDEELDISGRTFLNAGGVRIDRDAGKISLSRVFQWYGEDFGRSAAERLRLLAPYLYDEKDRKFIENRAETLNVSYQDYDWRLNRT